MLFKKCKVQNVSRLIKRTVTNKKTNDIQDIILRLNEVGFDAPNFVALNFLNLPSTSLDSFDMEKLSMILANASDSLVVLNNLQSDFEYCVEEIVSCI